MAVFKQITPAQISELTENVLVAGVDEVGRGPLIGDVVTCAVILDPKKPIVGLHDSKKLSDKKREALYEIILRDALAVSIGRASPAEIDDLNILQATMVAMQRAVAGLAIAPELILIDGNRTPEMPVTAHAIVKGDGLIEAISAASIVAKVTRDREMLALDAQYPQYGFAAHKGYPTKAHFEALAEHGILPEHRKSFKPVAAYLVER